LHERLNGRTTTLVITAVFFAVTLRRFSVVVVGSRGVFVCLGGVRVPRFLRDYGLVFVNRTGIGCAGFPVTRAIAITPYAENRAQEPQQRECPRENAKQGTHSRFMRNSHL
jgi:hypothetical protein